MSEPSTKQTTISPERLRSHAKNIGHSRRGVYPVGPLLDAADEIERLHGWLSYIDGNFIDSREAARRALDGEPLPEGFLA